MANDAKTSMKARTIQRIISDNPNKTYKELLQNQTYFFIEKVARET